MRAEREIRPKWSAIYAALMSMFSSELATGAITQLQPQSCICNNSHIFVTSVTNDITNMRLQSHKSVSNHRCVTPVITFDPGHMLTLCA